MAIYAARIWRARIQLKALFNKHTATTNEPLTRLVTKLAKEVGLEVAPSVPCGQRIEIGNVALFVTQNNVGPLVWGLMPARLLIPSSLAELPQELQEAAIRHELAHVQRGDEWCVAFLLFSARFFGFIRWCGIVAIKCTSSLRKPAMIRSCESVSNRANIQRSC